MSSWWGPTFNLLSLYLVCGPIAPLPVQHHRIGHESEIHWHSDYAAAVRSAQAARTMALLWFIDPERAAENRATERDVFGDQQVRLRMTNLIAASLPIDAPLPLWPEKSASQEKTRLSADKPPRLLDHPALAELLGGPGIALVDLRDPCSPHYYRVVSVLPLKERRLTAQHAVALLDLPDGSLTQRTLIWAVRAHAEGPQSAFGQPSPLLLQEAASQAAQMAQLRLQGHHDWGRRFERLNGQLPPELVAQEICAESWPGQGLVEAAEECVRSWRLSPGHWEAVRTGHPLFGYDMCRGTNGTWYAAGVFGRRR